MEKIKIDEYIKKWSDKLTIKEDEIKKEYNKILEEERKIHPSLSDEEKEIRATQRLGMTYKKQLRSPAIMFEGMIIGIGDVIDTVARIRSEAIELFTSNPQKAILDGITDSDGMPLDNRREYGTGRANPNYGKPLPEHNYLRTIYGVASPKNSEPKFFKMTLSGELAKHENIPIFKPVRFKAINKSDVGSKEYILNPSTFTEFEFDESLSLPKPDDIMIKYCRDKCIDLGDLEEYHNNTENNINRLVIVSGDISTLRLEPTVIGSRMIVLEDESKDIDNLESMGTTCWVPPRIDIDFAEQSRVIVIGRTGRGKKRTSDGKFSDEPGDVMINVFGLYAIPEYKIEIPVEKVSKEDYEYKKESSEEEKEVDGKSIQW